MVEYVDQVKGVYVSKGCVYVSKGVSCYQYPIYIISLSRKYWSFYLMYFNLTSFSHLLCFSSLTIYVVSFQFTVLFIFILLFSIQLSTIDIFTIQYNICKLGSSTYRYSTHMNRILPFFLQALFLFNVMKKLTILLKIMKIIHTLTTFDFKPKVCWW